MLRYLILVTLFVLSACGGSGGDTTASAPITPPAPPGPSLAVFAGSTTSGIVDGTGSTARFSVPNGIAFDSIGNMYVAEGADVFQIAPPPSGFPAAVRKVSPSATVTTLAGGVGSGSVDGVGPAAQFGRLNGIAVDASGQVFVGEMDCAGFRGAVCAGTIRRIQADGNVTTFAGSATVAGNADGLGTAATFMDPYGLAFDAAGNLFVADYEGSVIRKVDPAGQVTTFAGSPNQYASVDGQGTAARLDHPSYIAFDAVGNLLVADGQVAMRRISPSGAVTTIVADVPDRLPHPHGFAVDLAGNLYFVDPTTDLIMKLPPGASPTIVVGITAQPGALVVRGSSLYITMGDEIGLVTNLP